MNSNLGVWDTLAALEWTKRYISAFGGDPDNITVIGQSAGGGIITGLLLAQHGNLDLPFARAWIASPALPPRVDRNRSRPLWDLILRTAECADLDCLRGLNRTRMEEVNRILLVDNAPGPGAGSLGPGVGFTPIVDDEFILDGVAEALQSGRFNKRVSEIVVGNTAFEVSASFVFPPPIINLLTCFHQITH